MSQAARLKTPAVGVVPVSLDHPATYADVKALPEHLRGEIIDGQLYALPRPRPRHGAVVGALFGRLHGPLHQGEGGPGGWLLLPEPELHLERPGRPIVPDVAGWRRERLPELPDEAAITLPPDWICEVLSASTEAYDRGPKMGVYGTHGVPWSWLIDPEARTLEVYRHDGEDWRPAGRWQGSGEVRAEPFAAVPWELASLWR